MKHFTPTTIVEPSIKIRRQRLLPTVGEVSVRIGQEVSPVQVVARTPRTTRFRILPLGEWLKMSPEGVAESLLVTPGQRIEMGSPLIRYRRMLRTEEVTSPVNGVVFAVQNGRLILQEQSDWLEMRAMVRGRVAGLVPNRGVELEINGAVAQGRWGSGKTSVGRLLVLANSPDETFLPSQLGADVSGRIIAVGIIDEEQPIRRAEDAGVRAIIAASMPSHLRETAVNCTMPILLTEGWGRLPMNERIYQLLLTKNEEETTVFAHPQDHFGQRPEIIIPSSEPPKANFADIRKPLAIGQPVRLTRAPYQGQIGEVVQIFQLSKGTSVGIKAPGADVVLANGQRVFVPLANLDAII